MSEETKTTSTTEDKQVLWVQVPWGLLDKEKNIEILSNVNAVYLNTVLAKQLQAAEEKTATLETKVEELTKQLRVSTVVSDKPDTSTTDVNHESL